MSVATLKPIPATHDDLKGIHLQDVRNGNVPIMTEAEPVKTDAYEPLIDRLDPNYAAVSLLSIVLVLETDGPHRKLPTFRWTCPRPQRVLIMRLCVNGGSNIGPRCPEIQRVRVFDQR